MIHRCRTLLWLVLALLTVQVPLLFMAAQKSTHDIYYADAVSYLRIAKYYSEGRFDLAVNGYWGPLFSWLMMPFLNVSENPVVTLRIASAFSSVVFLLGSLCTFKGLGLKFEQIGLAAFLIVLFGVYWSAGMTSPDLLMNGFLLTGYGLSVSAVTSTSNRRLFLSGLFYGLAYLTKAVALPTSLGYIVGLTLLRLYAGVIDRTTTIRILCWSITGFALLASPWIIVLSLHYGKPTFSTSGPIIYAIAGPNSPGLFSPSIFQAPEPGRITTWEEPSHLPFPPSWSPFQSQETFLHQLKVINKNMDRLGQNFSSLGATKPGQAAMLTAGLVVFFWPGPWRERLKLETWRLSIPAIAILCGVYLPVVASEQRYFLSCYPLLLSIAFGFSENLAGKLPYRAVFKVVLPTVVFLAFLWRIEPKLENTFVKGSFHPTYVIAERIAPLLRGQSIKSIASVERQQVADSGVGFYTAFLAGIPFYGNNIYMEDINTFLESRAEILFINNNNPLIKQLETHPCLKRIDPDLRSRMTWEWGQVNPVWIYRVTCR